ncbi:hypothetical protein BJ741DRAFT_259897 [Chytriomyces cf. hyalinus JEL632]|nr:hypothetical protein BJ741DRAFT_259897 [Chytriomyces cf. hyalinus JEL632]
MAPHTHQEQTKKEMDPTSYSLYQYPQVYYVSAYPGLESDPQQPPPSRTAPHNWIYHSGNPQMSPHESYFEHPSFGYHAQPPMYLQHPIQSHYHSSHQGPVEFLSPHAFSDGTSPDGSAAPPQNVLPSPISPSPRAAHAATIDRVRSSGLPAICNDTLDKSLPPTQKRKYRCSFSTRKDMHLTRQCYNSTKNRKHPENANAAPETSSPPVNAPTSNVKVELGRRLKLKLHLRTDDEVPVVLVRPPRPPPPVLFLAASQLPAAQVPFHQFSDCMESSFQTQPQNQQPRKYGIGQPSASLSMHNQVNVPPKIHIHDQSSSSTQSTAYPGTASVESTRYHSLYSRSAATNAMRGNYAGFQAPMMISGLQPSDGVTIISRSPSSISIGALIEHGADPEPIFGLQAL